MCCGLFAVVIDGGGTREAKRGVILSVALASWEVERSRLGVPVARCVSEARGATCVNKIGQAKELVGGIGASRVVVMGLSNRSKCLDGSDGRPRNLILMTISLISASRKPPTAPCGGSPIQSAGVIANCLAINKY